MKNKKVFFTTKWITYTAMLTALVIATCAIPPVYIPGLTGGVYWCDCIIIIAAFLLDPVASLVVGGVGTLFYDMVFGNAVMAPVSLLIHGLQAAVISVLLHFAFPKKFKKLEPVWAGISAVVGALVVIGGYFLYYWTIAPLMFPDKSYGLAYAAVRIPRNIIQEIIGIAIAMVICYATTFKQQLAKSHLLPDFKGEVLQKQNAPTTNTQGAIEEEN